MSEKRRTITFKNKPVLVSGMSVVGKKESMGPIGNYFDYVQHDAKWGQKTFEQGELMMLKKAVFGAIDKLKKSPEDIDVFLSGDLLNQIVTSSYVAEELNMGYLGIYSACSTMTEALTIGALLIDSEQFDNVACATCSHFATAERQYRYPLEYGCQRPPYAQWTATAAGCSILSKAGSGPKLTHATIGKVIDYGISDLNNMGAAMAPAALDTILKVFADTGLSENDFDLILTGDLGKLGSDILRDLLRERGIRLGQAYHDCGEMMYSSSQKCYSGGSGAGCMASVLNSFVLKRMASGMYKRVLLLATGALMNPTSCYQGGTIPSVSHGIILETSV